MSTRCSIGYTDSGWHLYKECNDEHIWINDPEGQLIKIMPEEVWNIMQQQIISGWLQELSNGQAKLNEVWGVESKERLGIVLNKEKLIMNFCKILETVEN